MIGYKESFRFSTGVAEFDVAARTVECSREGDNTILLVFDILSKPAGFSQNRVFDIGSRGCESRDDAARLARQLLEETYGTRMKRAAG